MIQTSTHAAATTSPRFDTDPDITPSITRSHAYFDRESDSPRIVWWSAIVAGAVAAIALQVLFALLGTAIGLTVVAAANDAPEAGLSMGGAIYWLVTGLISLFVGGMIAGRMRGCADRGVSAMHGFLTWCTVTAISLWLLTMAGGAAVSGTLGMVGDAMGNRNANVQVNRPSNNQASNQSNYSNNSANSATDTTLRVSEEDAKEAAGHAATASWWTLIALVLGATVASLGGASASRNDNDRRIDRVRDHGSDRSDRTNTTRTNS